MNRRTRRYLAGRFRDHYRRATVETPPDAHAREWGYIPFASRGGTTMVRHRSLAGLGDLSAFLRDTHPRHVYYSAGTYSDPGAGVMGAKDWRGADLIFDLDADHLPGVSPEDPYGEMLARCKEELQALLDLLQNDFGFEDLQIVFSGGRGYHVHVQTEEVRPLPQRARREIAEYVHGEAVTLEGIVDREVVAGVGRQTPASTRRLDTDRGWGARVHRELMELVEELRGLPEDEAGDRLREIEGIGGRRAEAILEVIDRSYEEIAAGNVDVHPAFLTLVDAMVTRARERQGAAIDEPVTTDVNRLIRLPGSLHGGSGLVARPIDPDTLELFDPLVHAIPETFRGQEITIEVTEPTVVELGGTRRELDPGTVRVPEFVGVHLMVTERAVKVPEPAR